MTTILSIVKHGLDRGLNDEEVLLEVQHRMPLCSTSLQYVRRIRRVMQAKTKVGIKALKAYYSPGQWTEIERLFATIKGSHIPSAVVDYLGRLEQDDSGAFVQVQHDAPRRFGIRDMRNVALYQLTVVKMNRVAEGTS